MLYITRRVGQSLMIGDGVEVIVDEVRGRTVKLAVRHPAGVQVLRRELYDRIREENVAAAQSAVDLGSDEASTAAPRDDR